MKKTNIKITDLIVKILLVLMSITVVIGCREIKEDRGINSFNDPVVFGIKFKPKEEVRKVINSQDNLVESSIFRQKFIQLYNDLATSSNKDSKAFVNNSKIVLSYYQSSFRSRWYVDLDFSTVLITEGHFNAVISFDFIYGPTKDISKEKFQSEIASDSISKLMRGALNKMK